MLRRLLQIQIPFLLLFSFYGSVWAETINFNNFSGPGGGFVDEVSGDAGSGPIGVNGQNPNFSANAARIFTSNEPPLTGNDFDLGTPNNQCPGGGPGNGTDPDVGPGGTFENCTALGNVLIIDARGDPSELPNDIDEPSREGVIITFDFTEIGAVTVEEITVLDFDGNGTPPDTAPRVELFGENNDKLAEIALPNTMPENGAATVGLEPKSGVVTMVVYLQGSGAIDNIVFERPRKASLGNCIWQDLNNDGIQAGDGEGCVLGSDSEPPVPDVPVKLLNGNDCNDVIDTTTTDADGFYLFDNLEPGTYCVKFEKPSDLCDAGDPEFTAQGVGNDDLDSDADPETGVTDPVTLAAGEENLSVDAGLFCPSIDLEKFTNGYDADGANGFPVSTPPPGPGFPDDVGGNQVPLVAIGDEITWTYRVTNPSSATLTNIEVTDSKGVSVDCEEDTLGPRESFECTATGKAEDLAEIGGDVQGCDAEGQGTPVPTYENEGKVEATVGTTGVVVSDVDLSHYCNPPGVMIEKFTNGWDGDFANGIPTPGNGESNPEQTRQVAEIPGGGDITWTYEVTNTSNEDLENVVVTDSKGVIVDCPKDTLAPAETITCTATGSADDLAQTGGDKQGCGAGTGETRPTYANLGMVDATGETTGVLVEDDDPSHYCNPEEPPECGLNVEKGCEIARPSTPSVGKCDGKLKQFTVIWNGAGDIGITVGDGLTRSSQSSASPGDEVTFFTDGSTNDTIVNLSGAVSGRSTFHVSCSDDDFNSPDDCGKTAGDGKDKSGFINQWLLEGFIDKNNVELDCTGASGGIGDSSCTFQAVAADCKFPVDKPDSLTWLYSGGGCGASNNDQKQSGDLFCTGEINGNDPVTITDDKGNVFNVEPGGVFTTSRDASKEFTLSNGGGTENNGRHVSCSQPLQAGDIYGSLTLAGLDGNGLGTNVVYSYRVGNEGPGDLTDIKVTDDQLGTVPGSPITLAADASRILTATAFITKTTTNTATAVASPTCSADSNPVLVTVKAPKPCDVSIVFDKLEDDKVKWKLTNGERKATLQTFTLDFPSGFDVIKKVKLDGDIYKADDSNLVVGPGVTIGEDDWTKDDVTKRQLDPGETRTLEVEFEEKDKSASQGDFDLFLTFKEGCNVGFNHNKP